MGAPGLGVTRDGKYIRFSYEVQNSDDVDYKIESLDQITVMARVGGGRLSQTLPDETAPLTLPVFIPAKQKGTLILTLALSDIPPQKTSESEDEFHERLSVFCEQRLSPVTGFVVFDKSNRYQVELPKWLLQAPPKKTP